MSISVPNNREGIIETKSDLSVRLDNGEIVRVYEAAQDEDATLLPFEVGKMFCKYEKMNKSDFYLKTSSDAFVGELRERQIVVRDKSMKILRKRGNVIISAEPGFGKTITCIEMICTLDHPTMIFVKQSVLVDQWIRSFEEFAPSKSIFHVRSNKPLKEDADVYIVNPLILRNEKSKFSSKDFSHVKVLVVDELHQIVTKTMMKAFFKFKPMYLIGLSATPYRPKDDPYAPAIEWFFGKRVVGDKLSKKHEVYVLKTNFVPDIQINRYTGKLDWNSVLTSQCESKERNALIVEAVLKLDAPDKNWLILVKRIEHAKLLKESFVSRGLDCDTMIGSEKTFDKSVKVLIGTTPKIGVGFDHAPINALCMAADVVEYFEQFLGRCMRKQDSNPIVLDFKDSFGPLENHLSKRIQKYKECGGTVKTLHL